MKTALNQLCVEKDGERGKGETKKEKIRGGWEELEWGIKGIEEGECVNDAEECVWGTSAHATGVHNSGPDGLSEGRGGRRAVADPDVCRQIL